MSAKTMSSLTDEKRDLRKQIGCMNGIFQLFDRHHFLTGRRISSHSQKRLLQGPQHQLEPQLGTKGFTEKGTDVHKEKPRISTESSRASYSSSSCSSTFSSLDFNRLVAQTESLSLRQINISETPFQQIAKEQKQPFRDVVKESMHREARVLPIKSTSNNEQRGVVMKHIDSPRPSPQPKSVKQPKDDDRLALPRFSYDGRESREGYKSAMKQKELPRFSLDSKASSMKCSSMESRLNFSFNQESGIHNRTSSVVAKLMGLEIFPDTISSEESRTPSKKPSPKEEAYSPRVSQSSATSASPRKPTACTRFPIEPAPWSQQDSPKKSSHSKRAPTSTTPHQSYSVYGQIEKRITELEFKRSGKDLRALKQILESMQKTRTHLENQLKSSSAAIIKPAKVMDTVKFPVPNRVENSAHRKKANNLTQKRSIRKEPNFQNPPSADKKYTWRNGESDRTPQVRSPRLQQKLLRIEEQSRPTTPSSGSGRAKKHCNKKIIEKGQQNSKHRVKVKDRQFSDEQLSDLSSETRYSSCHGDTASVQSESNNSLVSQTETEVTSAGRKENSVSTTREHMPAVRIAVTILEQPSPISVLDDTFYSEDSPSPIKKISSAFREDESPNLDEAEWYLTNLNRFTDCKRSNPGSSYNLKLENTKNFAHELPLLDTEPDETSANQNALAQVSLNPNHRYINKILLTSGLLKDSSFISTSDKLLSSNHLINPDMFHVLEQTEENIEKNDKTNSNKKIERKIVFDMVDEILVRKITSGRLFTMVKKRTSPQGLLKEVYSEIDRLCTVQDCDLDNEEDEMIRQLNADIKYESEDWVDYSGELPGLVLDIERLIFKDMINEVVTGGVHDWPKRHCRKLFSK
ncbi:hypothetical protein ACP275_08G031900 [Erythranthe tilingii]